MKNRILIIVILMSFAFSAVNVVADDAGDSAPTIQLPSSYITMLAEYGANSWFDMDLSDVPEGYDVTNGQYHGWCVQKSIYMTRGVSHAVVLYSSYNPNMPQTFSNANWDKINYMINHKQGNRESIQKAIWYYFGDPFPSDPDAQSMIADANVNGVGFVSQQGESLAIIVDGVQTIQRSFFELTCPETQSGGNGGNPGGSSGESTNHVPTADATAGQPYEGFVGKELVFNGSRSYDRDGYIDSYYWDFGDGANGSEAIVSHIYNQPGKFTVQLTVTDDDGATNTHTVTAKITWENYPPEAPVVTGTESGQKNTSYAFTAISTDKENDSLQYIFEWGDGETTTTEFLSYGTLAVQAHSWASEGFYTITVKAFDNRTESGATTLTVLIDVCYVGNLGYLIDTDGDGTYDSFYNNATGMKIRVGNVNGNYLLDTNEDGLWDYEYNLRDNSIKEYSEGAPNSVEGAANWYTMDLGVAVFVAIIILVSIFVFWINKREKTSGKGNGRQ